MIDAKEVGGRAGESGSAIPIKAPLFKGQKPVPKLERTLIPPPTNPAPQPAKNTFGPTRGDVRLTAEQAIAVGELVGTGLTLKQALTDAQISMGCWKANIVRYAIVRDAFESAIVKAIKVHVQNVAQRVTNWQASAWILERTQREQFGKLAPSPAIHVTTNVQNNPISAEVARDLSSRALKKYTKASRN